MTEQETDGRWIAEILLLPGCMVYGETESDARSKVQALALRVIADRIEHGEEDGAALETVAFVTSAAA